MQIPDFAAARIRGTLRLVGRHASDLMRLSRWPATEPYFGRHKASRFDDPLQQYGVSYAAFSLEVAFAETVLHENVLYEDGAWVVPVSLVRERSVVYFDADRELVLADLTGPSLKALGLDNQLSAGTDYAVTWAVSRALHDAVPECDGILYVSRHHNKGEAVALFDRTRARIHPARTRSLGEHEDIEHLLQLFGVVLVPDADPPEAVQLSHRPAMKRIR